MWLPRIEVEISFLHVNIRVVSPPLQGMSRAGCGSWVFLHSNTQKLLPISNVPFPSCLFSVANITSQFWYFLLTFSPLMCLKMRAIFRKCTVGIQNLPACLQ